MGLYLFTINNHKQNVEFLKKMVKNLLIIQLLVLTFIWEDRNIA